jgi:flagellar FliL protein
MSNAASPAAEQVDGKAADHPKPRGKRRKLVLLAAVPLLLAMAGVGLSFAGILPKLPGLGAPPPPPPPPSKDAPAANAPVFLELPEIIANLNTPGRHSSYVKVHVRLELARAVDEQGAAAVMPRLQDLFQTYLREMRPEELRGSAGTYRLREELIARANLATAPARVVDVLFTELLVQ